MALAALMALLVLGAVGATAATAEYTVKYWVEAPDYQGDPGDPTEDASAAEDYILYDEERREGEVGETIDLTVVDVGEYLRTKEKGRRFASYLSDDQSELKADGTTEINVYYVRDLFEYDFDMLHGQAEMTIGGVTYTGEGAHYTILAKYEQSIVFPGVDNGLIPQNTNPSLPDAYCAGWLPDERTGSTAMLTYASKVSEELLPTDDMPYGDDLVFTLRGVWYDSAEQSILATWFEQLPEHEGLSDVDRMTYNGKTYVHFPATDFEMTLPKGAKPQASSAPGLTFVTRLDADASAGGAEAYTWKFLYDRESYTVTFNTNGAGDIPSQTLKYQQNLYQFDPGWGEGTTRTSGSTTYQFSGWYSNGEFVAYRLNEIYMPAKNLALSAMWQPVS